MKKPQALLAAIATFVPLVGFAQADDHNSQSSTVVLSPFEVAVERDSGYRAADTLSAGRLATGLLVTPADISVMTSQFMDDIATVNLTDVYQWLPNAQVNDPPISGAQNVGSTITIRGLPTGGNSRNYFGGVHYDVNSYLLDRVEQVRGPQSILYGTSLSGGQINTITKRPRFSNSATVSTKVDGYGSKVGMIDVNETIGKNVAIRVNAVDQSLRSWVSSYFDKLKAADFAVTVRPWKGGEFRIDAEAATQYKADQPDPEGFFTDGQSQWDGHTSWSAGQAVAKQFNSPHPFTVAAGYGNQVIDLTGSAITVGTGIGVTPPGISRAGLAVNFPTFPVLPERNFSTQPINNAMENHEFTEQAFFDQTWKNGIAAEISQSYSGIRRTGPEQALFMAVKTDINATLPNGQPNPQYLKQYTDTMVQAGNGHEFQDDISWRLNVLYPFHGPGFTQTFSLMAQTDLQHYFVNRYEYSRLNNGLRSSGVNLVNFRQYFDQPTAAQFYPTSDAAGDVFGWNQVVASRQKTTLNSVQLGTVGSYFHDTLTVIGGVRRDLYTYAEADPTLDGVNGIINGYTFLPYSANDNTGSLGFTYFPVKWVGLEAQYATGFNPNSVTHPFLPGYSTAPTTKAHVASGGLRFSFLNGRVVANTIYYSQIESKRIITSNFSLIDSIWATLGRTQDEPAAGQTNITDTEDYKGTGFEGDVTVDVSPHFRLIANIGFPKATLTNAFPATNAYFNSVLPIFQQAINAGVSGVQSAVLTEQNTLSGTVDGRYNNGMYRWKANVFGMYTFSDGYLKGFRIGGGVNANGKRLIGNLNGQPLAFIWASGYEALTGVAGYSFKIGGKPIDLQLNVSNLLNYSTPNFINVAVAGATTNDVAGLTFKSNYTYLQPRTFTLSARISL